MPHSIPNSREQVKRFPMKKTREKIVLRLHELHDELAGLGPIMRGSVVRLGPYKHILFSLNKDKKTRLIYLGKDREAAAKECAGNHKKLLAIIEEMTTLNMTLLKERVDPTKCLKPKKGRRVE